MVMGIGNQIGGRIDRNATKTIKNDLTGIIDRDGAGIGTVADNDIAAAASLNKIIKK